MIYLGSSKAGTGEAKGKGVGAGGSVSRGRYRPIIQTPVGHCKDWDLISA